MRWSCLTGPLVPALATALAQAGDPDRAEALARTISSPHNQAEALTALAAALAQAGDPDRASRLAAAAVAMAAYAPPWAWALLAAGLFVAFALAGRPEGKTITTRAELPAQVQPPTQDVIIRALGSIGIAEINKAIKELAFPPLPAPVREDGPGWRA